MTINTKCFTQYGRGILYAAIVSLIVLASMGAVSRINWSTQIANKPMTDIRQYGAVCDGTDQNTAMQAALSAGETKLYFPAGCMWIAPSSLVPANLTIYGQDWETSVIKSAANPTTALLSIGARTKIYNMNLEGNGCTSPTDCPVAMYVNMDSGTAPLLTGPYAALQVMSASGGDFPSIQCKVPSTGTGDCIYVENQVGAGGVGIRAYQSGSAGAALMVGKQGTGTGTLLTEFAGGYTAGTDLAIVVANKTGGDIFDIVHNTSTYAGTVHTIAMANGSGTFTGQFLHYINGGADKLVVDYAGNVTATGFVRGGYLQAAPATLTNAGTCNSTLEGAFRPITDSNTATWGATIGGSSTNRVLGYCDGTNWTVAAK